MSVSHCASGGRLSVFVIILTFMNRNYVRSDMWHSVGQTIIQPFDVYSGAEPVAETVQSYS